MALFDFGMKARRERDEAQQELKEKQEQCATLRDSRDFYHSKALAYLEALGGIASSTAKAGSAVRLANIARKALGRPVGGGDE